MAAAPGPGSRRYLELMTPDERSNIANAIWLCRTHAGMPNVLHSSFSK